MDRNNRKKRENGRDGILVLQKKQKWIGMKYGALTALYWMGFGFIVNYAAVQLQSRGISNTSIGVLISVSAVLSVLIQAGPASLVDRFRGVSIKLALGVMTVIVLAAGILYMECGESPLLLPAYAVMMAVTNAMSSLIYSMAMEYRNCRVDFNVGVCRSVGSFFCGTVCMLAGFLVRKHGAGILLPMMLVNDLLFLLTAASMENPRNYVEGNPETGGAPVKKGGGYTEFFRKYQGILLLMAGFTLLYMSGSALTSFQINVIRRVGGDEATLGIINGIGPYAEIPVMAGFVFLLSRFGSKTLLRVSTVFYILRILGYCFAGNPQILISVSLLQGVSYGLFTMSSVYYMNEITKPEDNAKGQALLGSVTTGFSSILASLLGGLLIDRLGVQAMLYVCVAFTAAGAALIWYCTAFRTERR